MVDPHGVGEVGLLRPIQRRVLGQNLCDVMAPAVRELVLIDRQIGIEVGTIELRGDETVEEKGSARTVIEGALELSKLVWGSGVGRQKPRSQSSSLVI